MEKVFNLIKNDDGNVERRVFPRFPISTMTFKSGSDSVFEVVDISSTGMQIRKRDGGHTFKPSDKCVGEIHWKGSSLECDGEVKWIGTSRLGVSFICNEKFDEEFLTFLSVDNVIARMKPLHLSGSIGGDLPRDLSCWLQSDGPLEIFVWCHRNGEVSKVQIIFFRKILEWVDGGDVTEGRIIDDRNKETPLTLESELTIGIGNVFNKSEYQYLNSFVKKIPEHFIKDEYRELILRIIS